jgi:hypothetical protein
MHQTTSHSDLVEWTLKVERAFGMSEAGRNKSLADVESLKKEIVSLEVEAGRMRDQIAYQEVTIKLA